MPPPIIIQTSEHWVDLPYRYPIHARSGWIIPYGNEQVPKRGILHMQNAADQQLRNHQGLTLRSISAHPYNCVGMIFSSRRAWIDILHIYQLLSEDGYREIKYDDVERGDVMVYELDGEPSHI